MAVLIQSETLTPPDHRKNQQALNAYIKALGGGIDFQGAIDAALATHQQRHRRSHRSQREAGVNTTEFCLLCFAIGFFLASLPH